MSYILSLAFVFIPCVCCCLFISLSLSLSQATRTGWLWAFLFRTFSVILWHSSRVYSGQCFTNSIDEIENRIHKFIPPKNWKMVKRWISFFINESPLGSGCYFKYWINMRSMSIIYEDSKIMTCNQIELIKMISIGFWVRVSMDFALWSIGFVKYGSNY